MKHPATDEVAIHRALTYLTSRGWRIRRFNDMPSYGGSHGFYPLPVARHIATTADDGYVEVSLGNSPDWYFLYFVLGNCPCEVLADHHTALSDALADLDMGEC